MNISQIPVNLSYGKDSCPLHIKAEFDRKTGFHSMPTNHFHSEYEIYYLFSGDRKYFIKERSYIVQPGDLVMISSNDVHKTSDNRVPNHERIVLYYEPVFFEAYPDEYKAMLLSVFTQDYPLLRLNLQERLRVEELLLSLLSELAEKPPGYGMHIHHMASEVLLLAARALLKRDVTVPPDEPSPMQRKITDIVRYINSHYMNPLDLDGLSAQFYISKSHLSRVFKDTTGFGFTEYVNITRIKEAQRLLRESNLSITEVSDQTGFDNFSHFGKIFKKLTGLPPRHYRSLDRS
ncbi:MAG: AraC family transcriptional regulator [Paenibacillaceae bacterium]|jgi:AraC-like DNA-binding protein/mannose-6-phosphate isomerase-like protein (cupin superfamily)|nr:AraC family transcriptional regulator [Paenibacillaceae bacterium]